MPDREGPLRKQREVGVDYADRVPPRWASTSRPVNDEADAYRENSQSCQRRPDALDHIARSAALLRDQEADAPGEHYQSHHHASDAFGQGKQPTIETGLCGHIKLC